MINRFLASCAFVLSLALVGMGVYTFFLPKPVITKIVVGAFLVGGGAAFAFMNAKELRK